MKNFRILSFVFCLLICFSVTGKSQDKLKYIYEKSTGESNAVVAIEVVDSHIHKIAIHNSKAKVPVEYYTKDNKTIIAKLNLNEEVGENRFNVFGYDANDKVVFFTSEPIVINRIKKDGSTGESIATNEPAPVKSSSANEKVKGKISIGNLPEVTPAVVDDPNYGLSIVPNFSLSDTKAKYYFVENKQNGVVRKTVRYSINSTKEQPDSPQKVEIELFEGKNQITIFLLDSDKEKIKGIQTETEIVCNPCDVKYRNINTRAIVGLEQVGASSAFGKTLPFLNFFLNVPLTASTPGKTPRFSIWTDFRISGSTVQNFADLANVSAGLLNTVSTPKTTVNNVVQSFRVTGGIDYKIIGEQTLNSFFIPGKSSLSFIAGGSITSPLESSQQTTEIYKIPKLPNGTINPEFVRLFNNINFDGKTNIAFVVPERDRFFRRWFAGMRLRHSFFKNREAPLDLSPATLDITFGQDEAITKKLANKVMTFEGFTPFPVKELDYIYLFGGATIRLTRKINSNVPPFFLQTADVINLTNSNDTVFVSTDSNPLTLSNRDTFRFGIGIDLIRLFNKTKEDKKTP